MAFLLQKLDVYKKALDLAEQITDLTEDFPRGTYYLADQLNRAVLSISANIAEGSGRLHIKERRNFLVIARGSTHECVPLLELANRKRLIDPDTGHNLADQLEVISKMLSGLLNRL